MILHAKMSTKRRITQETFDAAVAENIEEFEMEPAEAVEDAIEQFKSQGVDLSNIVTDVGESKVRVYAQLCRWPRVVPAPTCCSSSCRLAVSGGAPSAGTSQATPDCV